MAKRKKRKIVRTYGGTLYSLHGENGAAQAHRSKNANPQTWVGCFYGTYQGEVDDLFGKYDVGLREKTISLEGVNWMRRNKRLDEEGEIFRERHLVFMRDKDTFIVSDLVREVGLF